MQVTYLRNSFPADRQKRGKQFQYCCSYGVEAILISGESAARDFAINDPYVKNNLITRWYVRYWNAVNL